jgi:hypothetical protein
MIDKLKNSSNDGTVYHSLDDNLKWLSELSDQQAHAQDGSFSLLTPELEKMRLQGLRGNHWSVANLHSKLHTSK